MSDDNEVYTTGKMNLFLSSGSDKDPSLLEHHEIDKRMPPSKFGGISFIDNQNLNQTPSGCLGMLVAWSTDRKRSWRLGVLGILHPQKILIAECFLNQDLNEYQLLPKTNKFCPMTDMTKVDIHYINKVTSDMVNDKDQCFESPPSGSDCIEHRKLPKWFRRTIYEKKQDLDKIYDLLDGYQFATNKRKFNGSRKRKGLFNLNKGTKQTNTRALKAAKRKIARHLEAQINPLR